MEPLSIHSDIVGRFLGLPPLAQILLVLALWATLAWTVERIFISSLKALARRTPSKVDDVVIRTLDPAFALLLFAGAAWWTLRNLPAVADATTFRVADGLLIALALVAIAVASVRLLRGLLRLATERHPRYQTADRLGGRAIGVVVWILAGLLVLDQNGVEITPLLTGLGIAGLAVALALQDTLANFFSGIWIQTSRSMTPGHYVRLEDQKVEGFVEDVAWRTTRIRTLGGNVIVVPNQTVAKNTITDFWLPEPKMAADLEIVTGFEADPERVVPVLIEEAMMAADEVSYVLREPAPSARLNKVVENGWQFWLGFWVPHYYDQWNAQGYLLNRIRKRFLKEGIRIPYPIREQHVVPHERADVAAAVTAPRDGDGARATVAPGAVAEGRRDERGQGSIRPIR